MTTPNSQCFGCKHFNQPGDTTLFPNCKAFPEAIPIHVFNNKVLHTKPVAGDHGIQYEPLEE